MILGDNSNLLYKVHLLRLVLADRNIDLDHMGHMMSVQSKANKYQVNKDTELSTECYWGSSNQLGRYLKYN